jgi:TorA maturation chaperone TorD
MDEAPNNGEMAEVARLRSRVYGLLAAVYREEVSEGFLRVLKGSEVYEALSQCGVSMGAEFLAVSEVETVERLAVEYARLFLGPGSHISPHGSVHCVNDKGRGLLWGEQTAQVKAFIESCGFEYGPDQALIPDHISIELEFMGHMSEREALSWEAMKDEEAGACREIQKRFMEEHLLRWVPLLCEKVIRSSNLLFYAEMAALTKNFLEFDGSELSG